MYKIYQFDEDNSVIVLPIKWINCDSVKYHKIYSPKYITRDQMPNENWKIFKVAPLTNCTYGRFT